jgi:hypothetical protein
MGQDDEDGKGADPGEVTVNDVFDALRTRDARNERRIFWSEVVIVVVVALLVAAYFALWLRLGAAPTLRL